MSDILVSEHGALPLAPIDRPRSWFVRLLNWAAHRRYGKTPMAFRVLYARAPFLAYVTLVIMWARMRALELDAELSYLVQVAVAMFNGCTFCADLHLAEIARMRLGTQRFRELTRFESSSAFSVREKAAIAYARSVHDSLHISDAVWADLNAHFSERERVEIVWICAIERYYNTMALPLRIGSDGLAESTRA
jgi:AhpD family alkylhydroperoxidase